MEKATIIVEGTFRYGYEEHFADYSQKVRAYLEKHGAEVIRRQRVKKTLYGSGTSDLIMVIDFLARKLRRESFFSRSIWH